MILWLILVSTGEKFVGKIITTTRVLWSLSLISLVRRCSVGLIPTPHNVDFFGWEPSFLSTVSPCVDTVLRLAGHLVRDTERRNTRGTIANLYQ